MSQKFMARRSFLTISAMTLAILPFDSAGMAAIAAGLEPKKDYPVVVIGAGLGGLSCAAHLAKVGIPVTVVEQHDIPGGYATSFDRAGGKFTFEVSLEGTCIHDNDVARMLKDLGVLDKLEISADTGGAEDHGAEFRDCGAAERPRSTDYHAVEVFP